MILIGTMNWSSTRSRGMFQCPNCQTKEAFRYKSSRPFLTLYFIPVLPIGGVKEFIHCGRCKNVFDPAVLTNRVLAQSAGDAAAAASSPADPQGFPKVLLTAMALMMVEDGQVSEQEIGVARKVYQNILQTPLSREELGRTCAQVRLRRVHLPSLMTSAAQHRTHQEKLLLVQAMFAVAGADGAITPGRMQALVQAQTTLQIEEAEFQRTVSNTSQWLG